MKAEIIQELLDKEAWADADVHVELRETHISWVLLVGEYAYKVKKPVCFGFVDFSSLEKRETACRRELQLNRAFCPEIYLAVVAIRRREDGRVVVEEGQGEIVDFAVKMKRFPENSLFSRMLSRGGLETSHVDAFAERLAGIHKSADAADPGDSFGAPEQIVYWSHENLAQIDRIVRRGESCRRVEELASQVGDMCERLRTTFVERKSLGYIRDCHGDLHMANVLWRDGGVCLFDRIEFNDELRWIDVVNDMAFAAMDLMHQGRSDLAWRFVNRYFRVTGDYRGVGVLGFYMVYRALVRAKVALLAGVQEEDALTGEIPGFQSHLGIAERLIAPGRPSLTITCGLSGSGKTTRAMRLAVARGAIVVHSDVERKRMFGLEEHAASRSGTGEGIYTQGASRHVYALLADLALSIARAGFPVIVDAAFLRRADRDDFRALAEENRLGFEILYCEAPVEELKGRIRKRMAAGDVSEADVAVLEHQVQTAELPEASELSKFGLSEDTDFR